MAEDDSTGNNDRRQCSTERCSLQQRSIKAGEFVKSVNGAPSVGNFVFEEPTRKGEHPVNDLR